MSHPAPVRIRGLHERTEDKDFEVMTPAERVGMMWQLALDAWAFKAPVMLNPDFREILSAFNAERGLTPPQRAVERGSTARTREKN